MTAIALLLALTAQASSGEKPDPERAARMACVNAPLTEGKTFELVGKMVVDPDMAGIYMNDGEVDVQVLGIGPAGIWRAAALARPANGDQATVKGLVIDCNGEKLHVARTIVTQGKTMELRRADGKPAWSREAELAVPATP